jgi:hypothetical protein
MPLVATAGSASANSYTTLAYALNYFTYERVGGSVWLGFSDDEREAALIQATRELERKRYKGARVTATQALSWPRYGVPKRDSGQYAEDISGSGDAYYASNSVPADMQKACCELALSYLQTLSTSDATAGLDLSAFKSVKLGDDSFVMRDGQVEMMPKEVTVFLRDFLLTSQAQILRG